MKSFKKIFNPNNNEEVNDPTMENRNLWNSPNINYQVK